MSLAKALKTGNTKAAESLIESDDFDPNSVDPKTGESSLHLFAKDDQSELIKEILDRFSASSDRPANLELQDKEGKVQGDNSRLH